MLRKSSKNTLYRFKQIVAAGAGVPYYNTARNFSKKKGTSFGYGKKIGDYKKSESPGPAVYDNPNSSFRSFSKPNKNGKFGVGHDKFQLVSNFCELSAGFVDMRH